VNGIRLQLPGELQAEVERTLADWDQGKKMQQRLAEVVDKAV
jgi:hypothetical protein